MATAAQDPQQRYHICRCEVADSRNQRKLGTRTSKCATAALDGLCQEIAHPRTQLVQGSVSRCFQDLEKLCKVQTTMDLLKVCFMGYLRTRVTSAVSSASETSTTSRKCR